MKKIAVFLALLSSLTWADMVQNQRVLGAANALKSFFHSDFISKQTSKFQKDIKAIAIIPATKKAGLFITGHDGNGIFAMKNDEGQWGNPLFINLKGAGLSLGAGFTSSDLIILFQTTRSFEKILSDQDNLEFSAGITGVKGVRYGFGTDLPEISAWMVNPAKTTGVEVELIGVNVTRLSINEQDNIDFYGRIYEYEDILNGSAKGNKYAQALKKTLKEHFE